MTEKEQEVSRVDAKFNAANIEGALLQRRGPLFDSLPVMVEAAKLMARSGLYLPPHCRNEPGLCFAVLMKTQAWGLPDPYFMAEHSYVVTQKGGEQRIAYDSAVHQAALLASGAIIGRPQYAYLGEGESLVCIVSVTDARTNRTESYQTPPVKQCKAHSPLWVSNPMQQLGYYGLRNLVRLKYQDVLAGFYDRDEFEETVDVTPVVGSPNLMERLPGRIAGEGFTATANPGDEAKAVERAAQIKKNRQDAMARARAAKAEAAKAKISSKDEPKDNGLPQTKAEYIEYAQHAVGTVADPINWYLSEAQAKLRQACRVDDMTATQLLTLAKNVKGARQKGEGRPAV
jgi:hypothetical protein